MIFIFEYIYKKIKLPSYRSRLILNMMDLVLIFEMIRAGLGKIGGSGSVTLSVPAGSRPDIRPTCNSQSVINWDISSNRQIRIETDGETEK